jgi:hypothetical protein
MGLPVWPREERESSMQVDDRVRFCTGFVGMGTADDFTAHGTCFLIYMRDGDFTFDYFISAQHLLWPNRKKSANPPDQPMVIRLNKNDGGSKVIPAPPKDWIYPSDPTIDVCAFRFREVLHDINDELQLNAVGLETMALGVHQLNTAEAVGLSLGDEIFICGAFVGRVGYRKNIPVVRIGNIAAMPEEPIDFASPKQPAYLIETRSLGGTSGSPVFLNLQPTRIRRREHGFRVGIQRATPDTQSQPNTIHLIFPYLLLGMIIFIHGGNYAQDFISEQDSDIHALQDVEFNAGIAIALPVSAIIDLLNSDETKEARMQEIEKKRKQSGARPASAIRRLSPENDGSGEVPPANDANPNHRGDFMRLVNEAAKKRERED